VQGGMFLLIRSSELEDGVSLELTGQPVTVFILHAGGNTPLSCCPTRLRLQSLPGSDPQDVEFVECAMRTPNPSCGHSLGYKSQWTGSHLDFILPDKIG